MITSVDPRTGSAFGPSFDAADESDVMGAVAAAAAVADRLADAGSAVLAAALDAVAEALDRESAALAALADQETALGVARLEGEVGRTSGQLRRFAALVRSREHLGLVRSQLPSGGPATELCRLNMPIGVVAVFAASNFPFAFSVAGGDTASALAAGCPVIVKAHYGHPQTSAKVGELARAALSASGVPRDALQILHGGSLTGQVLVRHPDVAAVGFTGSGAAGRALFDLAAEREVPIPVYAEQGSINPVVLAPSALGDVRAEAKMLAGSVALGGGQFCTKPGLILVPAEHRDEVASELVDALSDIPPVFLLTQKIRDGFLRAVARATDVAGVETWSRKSGDSGNEVPPTVLVTDSSTLKDWSELREEMFGPAVVVAGVHGLDDLQRCLSVLDGNLTGTVHGAPDDPWTRSAIDGLRRRVGRLVYGGVPTGVAVDPAMMHGGPYPATTAPRETSVGSSAIYRFLRPVAYQDFPENLLPEAASARGTDV